MKTLKYFALIGIFLFGVTAANAQQNRSKRTQKEGKRYDMKRYHKMNEKDSLNSQKRWAEEIQLSEDQREQIKNIREKRAGKIKALRREMSALKKSEYEEIQGVFTPEQKDKMKEMHSKREKGIKMKSNSRKRHGKGYNPHR